MEYSELQEFLDNGSRNCLDRIKELRANSITITHITSQELKLMPDIPRGIDQNLKNNSENQWPTRSLSDGIEYLAQMQGTPSGKEIATIEILHSLSDDCLDYYRYFILISQ